jgi:osmotically-inducible protein OsmY
VKKYFRCLVLAVAIAGLVQAASVSTTTGASKPAAVPTKRGLPDAQIERNIKARLAKSKMTLVGKERFTVSVKDGVATIEGKTNVIQHKGAATRIAKLSGAIAVQNRIEVSEAAKAKAVARLRKNAGTGEPVKATVIQAQK